MCGSAVVDVRQVPAQVEPALYSRYMFVLSFESTVERGYVSEKVFFALQSGAVPVYRGASNIHEYVPHNSLVDASHFPSPRDLAAFLQSLVDDRRKYEAYLKWKSLPPPEHVLRTIGNSRQFFWQRIAARVVPRKLVSAAVSAAVSTAVSASVFDKWPECSRPNPASSKLRMECAIKAARDHYGGMCSLKEITIFLSNSGAGSEVLDEIGANCEACLLACGAKVVPRYLCCTYCTLQKGDRDLELQRQLASLERRWPSAFSFRPNRLSTPRAQTGSGTGR
jgi:hypothetical protein